MSESKNLQASPSDHIRASSMEREEAITHLQTAFADGRLDEAEFNERMTLALKVKTKGELSALLFDLAQEATTAARGSLIKPGAHLRAILSSLDRSGPLVLPEHLWVESILGSCVLDLREATFQSPHTYMHVKVIMGAVDVIVPPDIWVELEGGGFLSTWYKPLSREKPSKDFKATLHIVGRAIMGAVDVRVKS